MRIYSLFVISFIFLSGCVENNKALFSKLEPERTGITFKNQLFEDGSLNVTNYLYFYNGGGVAAGDIDNDGAVDLFFTGNMVRNRLYSNNGDLRFTDITDSSGIFSYQGWCTGVTMVDINMDGLLDIYVCRSADVNPDRRRNLLFINQGNRQFKEEAKIYGLDDPGFATQSAFFDFDRDGDLDCFIINHSVQEYASGVQDNPSLREKKNPYYSCRLYRNDDQSFHDVSDSAGIVGNVLTFGLGLAIFDANNDGWSDIYVSNDFNEPDYFFINNKDGTFSESLHLYMDAVSLYSMGSDAADYNNDGQIDLLTLDMLPEDNYSMKMHAGPDHFDKFQMLFNKGFYRQYSRNMLQLNNGNHSFSEVAQLAGVSNTNWSWAALFADYNNDGYKDLFISNGYPRDYTDMDFLGYMVDRSVKARKNEPVSAVPEYIAKMPPIDVSNYLYLNDGAGHFKKKSEELDMAVSAGAIYADLDNDGDLDIVTNNTNDFPGVYLNNTDNKSGHYLQFKLNGEKANWQGIGAKIQIFCGQNTQLLEKNSVRGFQSSCDPLLHVGIGSFVEVDSLRITWPRGQQQLMKNIKSNQVVTLDIANASWHDTSANEKTELATIPLLSSKSLEAIHQENPFNDFTIQSLLPHYLSRNGPCISVGDVNNDGRQDFYQGGAIGQSGILMMQTSNNAFQRSKQITWMEFSGAEETCSVFADFDGDGDLDLFVGSGAYELPPENQLQMDRIFLNDGDGMFSIAKHALAIDPSPTSTVAAADLDNDGDIDLFIGGAVRSGSYPLAMSSKILLNDGHAHFTDHTAEWLGKDSSMGMLRTSLLVDINGDKRPDLVTAGEWTAIEIFINNGSGFVKETNQYITEANRGWWNTLQAVDIDHDGDLDLIAGNCGVNTQFKVSAKQPMTLYYADFDENGSVDPIICYYVEGVSYPAVSRDDLVEQLPQLKKKFIAYNSFANAGIENIFTKDQLNAAGKLEVTEMRTMCLINEAGMSFTLSPLPDQAQFSPVFGIGVQDFDEDGHLDLLLAGNSRWNRIKFGIYAANHGILIRGNGRGQFSYLPQANTGLHLLGDVRSLVPITLQGQNDFLVGINNQPTQLIKPQ